MTKNLEKNALVIGKGSIGLRHAEVLAGLGYQISFVSRRANESGGEFSTVQDALNHRKYGLIVISTETSRHVSDLKEALASGYSGSVLIEKPIFASTRDAESFHLSPSIFVGYNMRFNPLVQKLKSKISLEKIVSIQAYVGQNLNEWRKDRKATETYSALKSEGGGVLRDLSHELDLVTWLCGPLQVEKAVGGRRGNVTIDSEDYVECRLSGSAGEKAEVTLNYLDNPAKRWLSVQTDRQRYKIDFIAKEFWDGDFCERFSYERNESYSNMHRAIDTKNSKDVCDQKQGLSVLRLIESIEAEMNPGEGMKK